MRAYSIHRASMNDGSHLPPSGELEEDCGKTICDVAPCGVDFLVSPGSWVSQSSELGKLVRVAKTRETGRCSGSGSSYRPKLLSAGFLRNHVIQPRPGHQQSDAGPKHTFHEAPWE
jgi:hypothetical protein